MHGAPIASFAGRMSPTCALLMPRRQGTLPSALDRKEPAARDRALRVLLAGRQNAAVHLEVRAGSRLRRVGYRPGLADRGESPLTVAVLDDRIGYVRLHDSLGQAALVSAWDAALDALRGTDGLILDLRGHAGRRQHDRRARVSSAGSCRRRGPTSAMSFPARSVVTASGGSGWSSSRCVAPASTTSPSRRWSAGGRRAWARASPSVSTACSGRPCSVPPWRAWPAPSTAGLSSIRGFRYACRRSGCTTSTGHRARGSCRGSRIEPTSSAADTVLEATLRWMCRQ